MEVYPSNRKEFQYNVDIYSYYSAQLSVKTQLYSWPIGKFSDDLAGLCFEFVRTS